MEQVLYYANWVGEHWETIVGALTTLVTIASIVAKFTPSQADNKVTDTALNIIHKIALNPTSEKARPSKVQTIADEINKAMDKTEG